MDRGGNYDQTARKHGSTMKFRISIGLKQWLLGLVILAASRSGVAAVDVFLDFDAQWQANLANVATTAGVSLFNAAEIAGIQSSILQEFQGQLAEFEVVVSDTDPGGPRERVYFGAATTSASTLGSSMVDFRNTSTGIASIYTANFGFIVEPEDDRATQIAELSAALSGTGLHELGHSFGLQHQHAYGDPLLTPDRYGDTMGIQNRHLMGTGPTGITEEQRELPRDYSQWSQVIMEAAINLTPSPIPLFIEFSDVGDTTATAELIGLTSMNVSQTEAGFAYASLNSDQDVDVFAFDILQPAQLTAGIWSHGLTSILDDFDSQLRLYGSDGATLVAANDNILYSGNMFDSGIQYETDSMLLNIPLNTPGRYFLEVTSNGTVTDPVPGGIYEILFAVSQPVPEPAQSLVLIALFAIGQTQRRHWQ